MYCALVSKIFFRLRRPLFRNRTTTFYKRFQNPALKRPEKRFSSDWRNSLNTRTWSAHPATFRHQTRERHDESNAYERACLHTFCHIFFVVSIRRLLFICCDRRTERTGHILVFVHCIQSSWNSLFHPRQSGTHGSACTTRFGGTHCSTSPHKRTTSNDLFYSFVWILFHEHVYSFHYSEWMLFLESSSNTNCAQNQVCWRSIWSNSERNNLDVERSASHGYCRCSIAHPATLEFRRVNDFQYKTSRIQWEARH